MICTSALIINLTSFVWNLHDMSILLQSTQECAVRYENSPCLSRFIKVGERDYHIMCKEADRD